MNLELSDEQQFLQDAAQQALSRVKTVEAAREQLDGGERPDLWPVGGRGRLAGLLVASRRRRGPARLRRDARAARGGPPAGASS
jgi:hypothetical protein